MKQNNIILTATCIVVLLIALYYWNNDSSANDRPEHKNHAEQFKNGTDVREYYNAMAFQGGSVLGIAYVGALQQLQTKINFDHIKKYAGSSIGSLFALLMACKIYDWDALTTVNFSDFFDKSIGFIDGAKNLFNKRGVYNLDKMNDWIGNLLIKHNYSADITFRELFYKTGNELFIVATNLEQYPHTKYFSRFHDPDMPCRKAYIMSAAFPFVFEPVSYNGHLYCDGGMVNNYPLKILLDTPQADNTKVRTLGLKLANYKIAKVIQMPGSKAEDSQITTVFELVKRLTFITFNLSSDIMSSIDEDNNSIAIDALGQSPLNFTINDMEKAQLVESGRKAVDAYLAG